MSNKSKFAFVAAVTLATLASPAFAWTARTTPHRHLYNYVPDGPVYNYAPDPSGVPDPVNNPSTTGGGSLGYNKCAGHPSC